MSRRILMSVAALGALAAGALAGCASGSGGSAAPVPENTGPQEVAVDVAWLGGGAAVAVLLEGSSTCVPMADDVSYADGTLRVALLDPAADTACTRDLVVRGIPVALPAGVDPAAELRVDVTGDGYTGTAALAGVAGLTPDSRVDDGTPSAGWANTTGTFALMTFGSSSCRPQVEDAAVSAPGQIVVTFATPPADQVCTADWAPRVTVVTVPAVEPGTSYTAVLSGDAFEAVPVPIVGVPAP